MYVSFPNIHQLTSCCHEEGAWWCSSTMGKGEEKVKASTACVDSTGVRCGCKKRQRIWFKDFFCFLTTQRSTNALNLWDWQVFMHYYVNCFLRSSQHLRKRTRFQSHQRRMFWTSWWALPRSWMTMGFQMQKNKQVLQQQVPASQVLLHPCPLLMDANPKLHHLCRSPCRKLHHSFCYPLQKPRLLWLLLWPTLCPLPLLVLPRVSLCQWKRTTISASWWWLPMRWSSFCMAMSKEFLNRTMLWKQFGNLVGCSFEFSVMTVLNTCSEFYF